MTAPYSVVLKPNSIIRRRRRRRSRRQRNAGPASPARTAEFVVIFQADLGSPVPLAKIFRFTRRANHLYKFAPSHPTRGACHGRRETRGGLRWTRQRYARDGIAGRVLRTPGAIAEHADERCFRVRQNRVVLTPRRWRQVLRSCVGPTGLRVRPESSGRIA